jgi:hypothetical protein
MIINDKHDTQVFEDVYEEMNPDPAMGVSVKVFMLIADKHAPVQKLTVTTVRALWLNREFKKCTVQINHAKLVANKSGCSADWLTYCTLRHLVTTKNKKLYYQTKINYIKHNGKILLSILNDIMARTIVVHQ